jgi:hypothetical protein
MSWQAVRTATLYHWLGLTQVMIARAFNNTTDEMTQEAANNAFNSAKSKVTQSLKGSWKNYLGPWAKRELILLNENDDEPV